MRVAATSPDFFFVQIGANDGVIYDPLFPYVRRYHWAGILVEPVPCYFERLKEHHRDNPGLIFENVAIAEHEGVRDFFRLREDLDFLPAWCHGLGTFHREVLLTHKWALPDIEDYIVTHQVPCITLSTLFHRHRVGTIDLFLVDTEGHDYQVLRQLDLDKIKPRLIVYEHRYFKPIDLKACESLLTQHNYSFDKHLGNTLAFLPDD